MLEVKNITKTYGSLIAVDNISFKVKPGEILGFLGPNGAGKSTTMRVITGFLPFSEGTITVGGFDIEQAPYQAKSLIGYLPENSPAYEEMSVTAFLKFAAKLRGITGKENRQAIKRVLKMFALESVRNKSIHTLSKGYRQRCCFAKAMIHDPKYLILDEPTDGLDPNQKFEVRKLIKSIKNEKIIVISTHILEEVEALCTRIIIIDKGKIVFNGSPTKLRQIDQQKIIIQVANIKTKFVQEFLKEFKNIKQITTDENNPDRFHIIPEKPDPQFAKKLSGEINNRGWLLEELTYETGQMDTVFRKLTIGKNSQKNQEPKTGEQ